MIKVDMSLCTGCKRCMIACSFYKTGGFNWVYSSINIFKDIGGKPEFFTQRDCSYCPQHFCLHFCSANAIEVVL